MLTTALAIGDEINFGGEPGLNRWCDDPVVHRALGAAARICGTREPIGPEFRPAAPIPRDIGHLATHVLARRPEPASRIARSFVRAYRHIAAAIPPDRTIVAVGASADKFAFMHECSGNCVVYLPFSRDRAADRSPARVRQRLRTAGIATGESGRNKYAFVDFVFSGETFGVLAPAVPPGSIAVAICASESSVFEWPRGRVVRIGTEGTAVLLSKRSRCVPRVSSGAVVPSSAVSIAACNVVRLWILTLAARATRRDATRRHRSSA